MEITTAFHLLVELMHGSRGCKGPLFVDIDLTRRCNLRCLGCPHHFVKRPLQEIDTTVQDISMDLIDRLAAELPSIGTEGVIFAGAGEPLLHPNCPEIVSKFSRTGLRSHIFTNGILLNPDMAVALIHSGLDRLTVSLWAGSPEVYALCHPGIKPDNFHKILTNVTRLSRLKAETGASSPSVFLNLVCNAHTYNTIDDMVDIAHRAGCQGIVVSQYCAWDDQSMAASLTEDQIAHVLKELPRARERTASLGLQQEAAFWQYRFDGDKWRRVPCYIGWYQTRIRADGAVMPCCYCDFALGDLNKHPLGAIWNGPEYRDFRSRARTVAGLRTLGSSCSCDWCCYLPQNSRIHAIMKWLGPLWS